MSVWISDRRRGDAEDHERPRPQQRRVEEPGDREDEEQRLAEHQHAARTPAARPSRRAIRTGWACRGRGERVYSKKTHEPPPRRRGRRSRAATPAARPVTRTTRTARAPAGRTRSRRQRLAAPLPRSSRRTAAPRRAAPSAPRTHSQRNDRDGDRAGDDRDRGHYHQRASSSGAPSHASCRACDAGRHERRRSG